MSVPEYTVEEATALLRQHAFTIAADVKHEPPRTVIHCRLGGIGADWDLDGAIALVERSTWRGWVESIMGHNLGVVATTDGRERCYCFDVNIERAAVAS